MKLGVDIIPNQSKDSQKTAISHSLPFHVLVFFVF